METLRLLILWWISGVLILLQASGWRALRVAPLLRDNDEGPQPIEQGAAFLHLGSLAILLAPLPRLEIEASHSSEFEPLLGVSWRLITPDVKFN